MSKVLSTREGTGDDDDGFVRSNNFVRIDREKERGLRRAPASVQQREFTNTNVFTRNNSSGSTLQGE